MSNIISSATKKDSESKTGEPTFHILPHPAKTNNPNDLKNKDNIVGDPAVLAHHAKDGYIPSADIVKNLEQPVKRDELKKRSQELNK